MPVARRTLALIAAAALATPLAARSAPYAFSFSGMSVHTIRSDTAPVATVLDGVPTTIQGSGETQQAVRTQSGDAVTHTLTLGDLTFNGVPLADRVLTYTSTSVGAGTLCMAGTCEAIGGALPDAWWSDPTPLDVAIGRSNVDTGRHLVALQPNAHAVLGGHAIDTGSAGGTIEYEWVSDSPAGDLSRASLSVLAAPAVPEPGTFALLGNGLIGLLAAAGAARRRLDGKGRLTQRDG